MPQEPISAITLADGRYAIPLAVTVRSLLEHLGPERRLELTVIDGGGFTVETRLRLDDSWRGTSAYARASIRFVPPQFGGARLLPVWGRVPALTYARIDIGGYFPPERRRVLLLDSDLLVQADIGELADMALGEATVAATRDPFIPFVSSPDGLANYRELAMPPGEPYFNAGIMAVDLDRWRQERVAERAFDFIARHWQTLHQYDQDSLNVVLHRRWLELDPSWQVHPRMANALGRVATLSPARILHFSGSLKPWVYRGLSEADRLFYAALDRTAWRGWRPPLGMKSLLLSVYDSPVRRVLYPVERRLGSWWRRRDRHTIAPQAGPGS